MFGLLIKLFNCVFFFFESGFHVYFMHSIDMTALIVPNAVLILIKVCEILWVKKDCYIPAAS